MIVQPGEKPYGVVIRERDGKCRAVRDGVPLTGWLSDGMAVVSAMNRNRSIHSGS